MFVFPSPMKRPICVAWGTGKKQLTKYIAKGTSIAMDVEYSKKWNELEKYTSGNPCFWKPSSKQFLAE